MSQPSKYKNEISKINAQATRNPDVALASSIRRQHGRSSACPPAGLVIVNTLNNTRYAISNKVNVHILRLVDLGRATSVSELGAVRKVLNSNGCGMIVVTMPDKRQSFSFEMGKPRTYQSSAPMSMALGAG